MQVTASVSASTSLLQKQQLAGIYPLQRVSPYQLACGREFIQSAVRGISPGIGDIQVCRVWRYENAVGRLHLQYFRSCRGIRGKSVCHVKRGQADGVCGEGVGAGDIREAAAYQIEAVAVGTGVCGREIKHPELLVRHVHHHGLWCHVITVAGGIDTQKLSAARHIAEEIDAPRVDAPYLAHRGGVHHRDGALILMTSLTAVSSGVCHEEPAVIVCHTLRLVAHMTGVYYLLRPDVNLGHIAVVGIRGAVEISAAVGGEAAVVWYVFGGCNRPAVGIDILYDVRPVHRYGNQRVVHLQYVVARVAEVHSGIVLLEPPVCHRSAVDIAQRGVVESPQSLAENHDSVVCLRGRYG